MTLANFTNMLNPNLLSPQTTTSPEHHQQIQKLLTPMGITNENVCELHNIPRYKQDQFAYESHMKASNALDAGKFTKEIHPITINNTVITKDNIIRASTNITTLSKLKPSFKANGTTTAGNSSALSIGGALCLLTTRRIAKQMKMTSHVARIIGYAVVGVPPEIMGVGPSRAIPAVLMKCNLTINDIDVFEINEAFAGQALYCIEQLNIPKDKVNIHGGAIALGHPLGCTGARMVVSLLNILHTYKKKRGLISMCIGTGMGAACVIERELL
jgi:acetyl-CoA acyltransferase 1